MTIDGINFLKLFKKSGAKETSRQEETKKPSVEPEMTEEERTILSKMRNSAVLSYAMALLAAGGATTMQSCSDDIDQVVTIDNSELVAALNNITNMLQKVIENQSKQLEYLQEMNSDNKTLIDLLKEILTQGDEINSILASINGKAENVEAAIDQILALITDMNANDQEFLDKLDQIIANQGDATSKLDQIIDANNEQNALLVNLQKLLDTLKDTNSNIYNTVLDILNEYQNGNISHSEMLEQILGEIKNNGSISSDILAAINDLSQKFENGQISESEMIQQIINLLASIDGKLDGLKDAVDQITAEFPDLASKIDEFIQKYEQGSLTQQELLTQILNAMQNIPGGGGSDGDFSAQLDAILAAINQGNVTFTEAMDKIIELLGQIESNTGAILDAINKLAQEVGNLNANFENNQDQILELLGSINSGVGSIDSKLDQIEANQEKNNETTLEISQKMDELYSQVAQINEKTLTISQVQDMLGPMYEEIKGYLSNISGNQITVGDLEAALEAHRTDLTQTNALIETLISVVSNLDVSGGGSGNSAALEEIANAIREFQNQSNSNSAQVNANLMAVLERLANMEGSLDAIVETGNNIQSQFESAMNSATRYGDRLLNELQNISGNMVNKTTLQLYADQYTEYLQKAEQARQEQYAVLQSILANMGKGNSGMTIDELKEIIPDYTDILNEISDKIGNLVTSSDLEAYFEDSTVDLTQTNALIETLISVVSNLNGGSVDTAQLNSTLNAMRQEMKNNNAPTKDQVQTLIDLVQNAQSTTTRSAGATYKHPGWQY